MRWETSQPESEKPRHALRTWTHPFGASSERKVPGSRVRWRTEQLCLSSVKEEVGESCGLCLWLTHLLEVVDDFGKRPR